MATFAYLLFGVYEFPISYILKSSRAHMKFLRRPPVYTNTADTHGTLVYIYSTLYFVKRTRQCAGPNPYLTHTPSAKNPPSLTRNHAPEWPDYQLQNHLELSITTLWLRRYFHRVQTCTLLSACLSIRSQAHTCLFCCVVTVLEHVSDS